MLAAMYHYPGGTSFQRDRAGYLFCSNFWCDLLHTTAYNGQPNDLGANLGSLALSVLAVTLGLYWWLLAQSMPAARTRPAILVLGLTGSVGMGIVAEVSVKPGTIAHGLAIVMAGPCGLAAMLVALAAQWKRGLHKLAGVGALGLALALWNLVQYSREYLFHAASAPLLPAVQKAATLLVLAWVQATTWKAVAASPSPGHRSRAT